MNSRSMLLLEDKHTAFVFSDPAGGNACMAMAKIFQQTFGKEPLLFSNKPYSKNLVDHVAIVQEIPDFRRLGIECVFTGTSHPASSGYFELNCIREAKRDQIKTISFIDHWVNFRLRFTDEAGSVVYPDEIWVIDEKARELAIREGLPAEKLQVRSNPYYEYLKNFWQPAYNGKTYWEQFNINTSGFHLLFAPDPLTLRGGKAMAGFTEDEALKQVIEVIGELQREVQLIVKCHPLQPRGILEELVAISAVPCRLLYEGDSLELMNASDLVLGFYSNILIEGEIIGRPVLRYFPGNVEADYLRHRPTPKRISSKEELLKEIKSHTDG